MIRILLVTFVILLTNLDVYAKTISIVTEHLVPFQYQEGDTVTGYTTEVVKAVVEKSGFESAIEVHPWSLSYSVAKKEKNTCIYSMARVPERESSFQWIGRLTYTASSFYSLNKKKIDIKTIDDARKYRIAVLEEDVAHHYLLSKGFIEGENLYALDNYKSLLTLLEVENRRIDLVIIDDNLIKFRFKDINEMNKYKRHIRIKDLEQELYFACSNNTDDDVIKKLQESFTAFQRSEEFNKIKFAWEQKFKIKL